jgi:uncharacterized protein YdeI (YjbR/CyaY-like superfamily)
MGKKDKRIDAYIAKSAPFAQPILKHLRELVHSACTEVEETMKWSFPHFEYSGEILCSMAAFKNHCAFGFWKAPVLPDPHGLLQLVGRTSMGSLGSITSLSDLPSDRLLKQYVREAAKLNREGVKVPQRTKTGMKKELEIPDYFTKALNKSKKALATFNGFSTSNKREYVEWVTSAKTEETRENRLASSIQWMEEGKVRNWKYLKPANKK